MQADNAPHQECGKKVCVTYGGITALSGVMLVSHVLRRGRRRGILRRRIPVGHPSAPLARTSADRWRRCRDACSGFTVGACELQRAQEASGAQSSMVGMSKEQVLTCMGSPAAKAAAGATEVWTYDSGDGRTDTIGVANAWGGWGHAFGVGSSTSTSRYCKVNVVMVGNRVSRVNHSGPTGGLLTGGEQCAFAVENCLHQAAARPPMPGAEAEPPQPLAGPNASSLDARPCWRAGTR